MFQLCMAFVLLASIAAESHAQTPKRPMRRDVDLQAGQVAPDFTLRDMKGENPVTLSKLRGKPVVLIFGSCT